MRSNDVIQMTDIRRISPQTTSSSGYHSDLSSANQSPQSIHENIIEPTIVLQIEKKTGKSFSRLSSFIRKQYERAKLKLLSSKQQPPRPPPVTTCSKATSTTPLSYLSESSYIKLQQPSSIHKRSSFIEPVYSIYVHPYDKQLKIPLKNSTSNYECCTHQSSSYRSLSYTKPNNSQVNSHSYRRLVTLSNYENMSTGYLSNNSNKYYVKPRLSQNDYPYIYLNKNYNYNRLTYAPLSDFISTRNSAFKPIKSSQRPLCHISEQIPPSDDPCDLEVAQYFHQTPQWSNPNYFDIHTKQMPVVPPRKNYTETLC